MANVRIKDLRQGMVLANHARDLNGGLLLAIGEKITDKHILAFKAWGITEVEIDSYEDENGIVEGQSSEINVESIPTQVREELDELFRYTDRRHPAIEELIELCILKKMKSH